MRLTNRHMNIIFVLIMLFMCGLIILGKGIAFFIYFLMVVAVGAVVGLLVLQINFRKN